MMKCHAGHVCTSVLLLFHTVRLRRLKKKNGSFSKAVINKNPYETSKLLN
jgi:hypothetical protein